MKIGRLLLRAAVGGFFVGHGTQKLFGWFGGPGRAGTEGMMTALGMHPAKANALLDEAGWKKGPDGIRAKDGKRLKLLFQTSINAPRQKTQAIIKQAAAKAGIEIDRKMLADIAVHDKAAFAGIVEQVKAKLAA